MGSISKEGISGQGVASGWKKEPKSVDGGSYTMDTLGAAIVSIVWS